MDLIQSLRTLPRAPAPNDDVSRIKGNLQKAHMDLALRVFAHEALGPVFGARQAGEIKCTEIWVREVGTDGISRPLLVEDGKYVRDKSVGGVGHLEGCSICEVTVKPGEL